MSYRHHSRRETRNHGSGKVLIAGLTLAIVAGMAYLNQDVLKSVLITDSVKTEANGCPVEGQSPATAAILVDSTSALTNTHVRLLEDAVDRTVETMPDYGRVSVFLLQPNGVEPNLIFTGCAPHRKSAIGNKITRKGYKDKFLNPIAAKLKEVAAASESDKSPIFEAMLTISRSPEFQAAPEGHRSLTVVSDFQQNSDGFSVYNKGGDKKQRKRLSVFLAALPISNLTKVPVEAVFLQRATGPTEAVTQSIVKAFLHHVGAKTSDVENTTTSDEANVSSVNGEKT